MNYKLYKLMFDNGIHIGDGTLSSSMRAIYADTLFSAMCIEVLSIGGEDLLKKFVSAAKENKLKITDAMPYIGDTMYIPKPMCRIETGESDRTLMKEFKKMTYIPIEKTEEYMSGKLDPKAVNKDFSDFGEEVLNQKVWVNTYSDNEPYLVGVYKFGVGCGLYFIAQTENDEIQTLFDTVMESLQYSGLGGKRRSGYGSFRFNVSNLSEKFLDLLTCDSDRYMSLSLCMASDIELEGVLKNASYKLIRRGGFVQSDTYANEQSKKRDFFMFSSGAVFEERFEGDIFDVAISGTHPVYKYGKPIMIGIGGVK